MFAWTETEPFTALGALVLVRAPGTGPRGSEQAGYPRYPTADTPTSGEARVCWGCTASA